jgi:NADH-quinone oxidoreductase subunit J
MEIFNFAPGNPRLAADFGSVQHLGQALYVDFFFPFEAIILLFLIAVVGALFIAKKVK